MQLRRADVLRVARETIDAEGLDALQPNQGDRLFPTRPALLAAIADDLLAGVADAPPAGPWDQRLITFAHRLRRSLLSLRDGARLVTETAALEPPAQTGAEILREAGLPSDTATWTIQALINYVIGHALEEKSPTDEAARRFDFGLALILDGIRRLLQRGL
ncbi:TetR/AcrR family transcriptional regulator C-terminal domain-containing protein [Paractinoplanes globisporus]|uniref:TetR/AcrR family transcriptional regulator C-terminal domain-containing protein n=1 Tax=Paractinoplanes globisporus TaxID=113565 RepID=A0ABW6WIT3_9ACTN|nr:TetR/AcrR family transcriptional regulator C-terminal domain-containing protein [Actinoplanes globisporus]